MALRACSTVGWTNLDISPFKSQISFIKLDETYMRLSFGVKNILSISGARDLFIVANWNSYSKSDTALKPLTIAQALWSLATLTVSCLGKSTISTLGLSL